MQNRDFAAVAVADHGGQVRFDRDAGTDSGIMRRFGQGNAFGRDMKKNYLNMLILIIDKINITGYLFLHGT